jgi:S-DNA-T family DNA segregation ATPase FtsK/SpoIIIE
MSLLRLFRSSKSNRRSRAKSRSPRTKVPPEAGTRRPGRSAASTSFWSGLSPERRLDVIGLLTALAGLLIFIALIASTRSALSGGAVRLLRQLVGWGVYILPAGLVFFGVWLILRRSERIPLLSVERLVGSALLLLWLLTVMHSIIAQPEMAQAAANDGVGGGFIGGLLERILWFGLGTPGLVIALAAWLLIALTMVLDVTVQSLFRWIGPYSRRSNRSFTNRLARLPAPRRSQDPTATPPFSRRRLWPRVPAPRR